VFEQQIADSLSPDSLYTNYAGTERLIVDIEAEDSMESLKWYS
jgi:hypothetical protein